MLPAFTEVQLPASVANYYANIKRTRKNDLGVNDPTPAIGRSFIYQGRRLVWPGTGEPVPRNNPGIIHVPNAAETQPKPWQ